MLDICVNLTKNFKINRSFLIIIAQNASKTFDPHCVEEACHIETNNYSLQKLSAKSEDHDF